jgi:peptidoglycan-associated lipoprotein
MKHIRISPLLLPVIVVTLVAACSSTEEQKPVTPAATPVTTSAPAVVAPVVVAPVARQEVDATPLPVVVTPPTAPAAPTPPTQERVVAAPAKNSVYFDFDAYTVKPEFKVILEEHAKYLRANPSLKARVEGNADERGSKEYNHVLGKRRAEAVSQVLRQNGVPL